jgi:hypothetical protein
MRLLRTSTFIGLLFLSFPILAQHIQQSTVIPEQSTAPPPPAPRDPTAMSIVNQALAAAGGINAVSAIRDYSASGNITYHWQQDVQGTVNITALGQIAFRIDATMPTGVRSWAIDKGAYQTKNEQGVVMPVRGQIPIIPGSLILPHLHLATALNAAFFRFSYQGLAQLGGRSVHDIQIVPWSSNAKNPAVQSLAKDFFIDATTFQIVQTQDVISSTRAIHMVVYSDYRSQNGMLVPFAIDQAISGQPISSIRLSQISFNTGLQESRFGL